MHSHVPVPCRVVHLDLKSSNVLIAGDGSAKISDVGLAALMSQNYLSQMAPAGTWSWVAPEVILGGEDLTCMHMPLSCVLHPACPDAWSCWLRSQLEKKPCLTFCGRASDMLIWQEP